MPDIIQATQTNDWRTALDRFQKVDVCHMPEYHMAYRTRTDGAEPLMWCFESGSDFFCYPFLIAPVKFENSAKQVIETDYNDISSVYGFSGPLSTTENAIFLDAAWSAFDEWANNRNIIAEFSRFSIYAETHKNAHKNAEIIFNRPSAITHLPDNKDELLPLMNSKTRNMIRKAEKSDLKGAEVDIGDGIPLFRALYQKTMHRNDATEFFFYDDEYYRLLMSLPQGELRMFGVFMQDELIAAAILLIHKNEAFYHLGASLSEYSSLGAGNLALFQAGMGLIESGVTFFHVGGGRTTAEDDPLFRFKKNNATGIEKFYIGKRVVSAAGYEDVLNIWKKECEDNASSANLLFYR